MLCYARSAPEILRGQPHDESADTYSFGVLLYEIMSRELPYRGVDTFQVVMGVITGMLQRPSLPGDCAYPQQLKELMRASWSEEPPGRPRFNQILDIVDEVLSTLRTRPQVASSPVQLGRNSRGLSSSPPLPESLSAESLLPIRAASPARNAAHDSSDAEAGGGTTAVALFDHRATSSDELSFARGDTIALVELGPAAGSGSDAGTCWLRGELRGCVGLLRSTHVHVLGQDSNMPAGDPFSPGASGGRGVCHDPAALAPIADTAVEKGQARRAAPKQAPKQREPRGVGSMLTVGGRQKGPDKTTGGARKP
jgi:hypothetical protein